MSTCLRFAPLQNAVPAEEVPARGRRAIGPAVQTQRATPTRIHQSRLSAAAGPTNPEAPDVESYNKPSGLNTVVQ